MAHFCWRLSVEVKKWGAQCLLLLFCQHGTCLILHSRDDPPAVYLSCSISQSPAFFWGRSELTDRNVELYPQFFLELITTQLRFYMVSPQLSLLIILTMQSYKFYLTWYMFESNLYEHVYMYMHTYALCGYTRDLRTCRYAAILANRPSGISQAAATAVNRTQGVKCALS